MSQPLTLLENPTDEQVLRFFTMSHANYEIEIIKIGGYGLGFCITIRNPENNPFRTFMVMRGGESRPQKNGEVRVTVDRIKDTTGIGIDRHLIEDRIFMKLVPISEDNTKVKITNTNSNIKYKLSPSSTTAFTNECNKQKDIYAKTNAHLNSVCMPLFFYTIAEANSAAGTSGSAPSSYTIFIENVFTKTKLSIDDISKYGIALMPYSVNYKTGDMEDTSNAILEKHVTSIDSVVRNNSILRSLRYPITEEQVQLLFRDNIGIYLFIVILSLVYRLFVAGYCHGDLHSKNIMLYQTISSVAGINNIPGGHSPLVFKKGCLLIDWGFAWRHNARLPTNHLNYNMFANIIAYIIKSKPVKTQGINMVSWHPYNWFAAMFYDNVYGTNPNKIFNDEKCERIHILFKYFERYRNYHERLDLALLERLHPGLTQHFIRENREIEDSVNAYILSLPGRMDDFNLHGGKRHSHSCKTLRNIKTRKYKNMTRNKRRFKSKKSRR